MNLRQIPHNQLLETALQVARAQEALNSELLNAYLREIERRKLHSELGFKNAWDFFFAELGNSSRDRFIWPGTP